MTFLSRLLALLAIAGAALAQPPSGKRDLRLEKRETPVASAVVQIPRSYALIIGISRYKDLAEQNQLRFPDQDAAGIYTALISPEAGQFPAENVHRLIGPQATLANFRRELEEWLPSVSKEDDRVLIYFAGHGIVAADGKAYLAPYDINPDDIPSSAYPMDRLGEVFGARIKAKWRVLLTDACHSGAITPATDPLAINQKLQDLSPSVFSLTASRQRESSYEGPQWGGGHGVFTYYVIKGLDGEADTSGDGVVTADELAEYVHDNVRRDVKAESYKDGQTKEQNPTYDRGGDWDSNMVLAYNPTRVRAGTPPPPTLGRLIIESDKDGVEVFVDGKSEGVVNKGTPLPLPGLKPGVHTVQGVRMGYERYGPAEHTIYPGQDTTVIIRIGIPVRPKKKAAVDLFDKGLRHYTTGNENNYREAVRMFQEALAMEPTYSQAALYLGSAYNALFDEANADKYFSKAIELDPDYLEARARYAGALLDIGDYDKAIRQLNAVVQRDPLYSSAHYMLCVAFTRKEAYAEAAREGRESVRLSPANGEAHFWLAQSLRMSHEYKEAEPEYSQYLKLSDFDSKLGGKLNYYLLGSLIGMGKKKSAAQHDIWMDLRSQAYFGLCDCARGTQRWDDAIGYCQKALRYNPQDPFTHYGLGMAFIYKYNTAGDLGLLAAAREHFSAVIKSNSETEEAGKATAYIGKIDTLLRSPKKPEH